MKTAPILLFSVILFSFESCQKSIDSTTSDNLTQPISQSAPQNSISLINLEKGLVAYYPFNGNANDLSINKLNGVVNGASLTTDRFGKLRSAFLFTGNNNITIPLTQTNILTYSVCAWFKSTLGGVIIGGRGINSMEGLTMTLESVNLAPPYAGQIQWEADNSYGGIGQMSGSNYLDNKWHLVIGTFLSTSGNVIPSEFKIFIDGKLVNSWVTNTSNPPSTSPINNNNSNMQIGNHELWSNLGFQSGFNGTLDDIRLYNRVLNQSEITYLATH